jgi:hypothetical protein
VDVPFADEAWEVARRTPFYEDVRDVYFATDTKTRESIEYMRKETVEKAKKLAKADGGFFGTLGDNYLIVKK